jgi:hypothetical protein
MREEHARLQRALNDPQPEFTHVVLHSEPARMWKGMQVYADGADWDPGSGEGVYVRDKANAAWRYLG